MKRRREERVQTAAAMEAYNAYWTNSFTPAADIMWMVLILILAIVALWQARSSFQSSEASVGKKKQTRLRRII
ncbi:hypothetical protein EQO05_15030 [Methanosarcina sp. MSH10X1]|uniref:hypothetical protein n=1 Tax=Methanosarcina sp. MSH10X1 TaxID=2507075 RepID=UPI000FFBFA50|nr:hypothetical protein [Methanosarcina sp. MSH10X1]RXA15077.1 hypothetical protein EQO05_15030 [Methanosarcina sp. MSH10X1]